MQMQSKFVIVQMARGTGCAVAEAAICSTVQNRGASSAVIAGVGMYSLRLDCSEK